jgi:hypothetical protein
VQLSDDPVEDAIAKAVSLLLAQAPEDPSATFTDALGRMFEQLLANEPAWSRYWWVDDAHPERVTQVDDSTVEVAGTFVPSDERHQWIQPFRATLRLDRARTRLVAYRVSLCEEGIPMSAVPWGSKRPKHWPDVERWAFVFEGRPQNRGPASGDIPGH